MVEEQKKKTPRSQVIGAVIGLGIWTLVGFYIGQFLVIGAVQALAQLGVDFSNVNESVFSAVIAAVCYVVALLVVIGVPWLTVKHKTTRRDIGLHRLPAWSELGLAPVGFIAYFITSAVLMFTVIQLIPGFEADQVQEVGFSNLTYRYEYILAFLTLVVIAPVAEEMIFRGYLYGKLKKRIPWWVAAVIASALFGLAHGQWNVALDTFVLGMFLCALRDITGSLWPAILLHMLKNGIAYYFLFVNPTIINTIGG